MYRACIVIVFLLFPGFGLGQSSSDTCASCHRGLDDPDLANPAGDWRSSVHDVSGIGCKDCHGGVFGTMVVETAHDKTAGYVGVPAPETYHTMCGQCHDIQMENYLASPHGIEGGMWPTCIDCHTAHAIRPAAVDQIAVQENCEDCHEKEVTSRFALEVSRILESIETHRTNTVSMASEGAPVDGIMADLEGLRGAYRKKASHTFRFDTIVPAGDSISVALGTVAKDIRDVGEEIDTRRRFGWLLASISLVLAGLLWIYRRRLPQ